MVWLTLNPKSSLERELRVLSLHVMRVVGIAGHLQFDDSKSGGPFEGTAMTD
jgi:hypothetical protein